MPSCQGRAPRQGRRGPGIQVSGVSVGKVQRWRTQASAQVLLLGALLWPRGLSSVMINQSMKVIK